MLNLTDENFEKEIRASQKPVLVDFFATWCPPCSLLEPILEKLEKEYEGKVLFAKVNVDENPETSQKFGINPIPTVILFKPPHQKFGDGGKAGKPASGFVGVKPEEEIRKWLNDLLK